MTSIQLQCAILGHIRLSDLVCMVCGDGPKVVLPRATVRIRPGYGGTMALWLRKR